MSDDPTPGTQSAPAPYELRSPSRSELRTFMAPLEEAFGERFSPEEWADELAIIEPDRSVSAFDGETAVAFASAYTFRMTIPGGEIPVGGLTAVGVLPSHRRQGILSSMIAWHFADCRARGEPASILWASEAAIYQRFGYGPATLAGTIDLPRSSTAFVRPVGARGQVRFVDVDTGVRLIPPLYDRIRAITPGALDRTLDDDWRLRQLADAEYRRAADGPKSVVVYEEDGVPLGYAILRRKSEWDERGPRSTVTVVEANAVTPEATRGLWAWIFGIDLTARIRGIRQPVPHPLQLLLAEPRQLGLTVGDGIWLRLLDVPEALRRRAYAAAGSLVLGVRDGRCPWNAGGWRLTSASAGSTGAVERSGDLADLELDVADLAAVYLGTFSFTALAAAGRAAEVRPGAAADADRLFATDRAPWCSTMF